MKPLKPKYLNTVKTELDLSKEAKKTLSEYAKYTRFDESEIVTHLIEEIVKDDLEFVEWLKKRRYSKRLQDIIPSSVGTEVNEVEKAKEINEVF